jgi:hypothetical protein
LVPPLLGHWTMSAPFAVLFALTSSTWPLCRASMR